MIHFQGILPEILEELLAARKRAKADLKVTAVLYFPCKFFRFSFYFCSAAMLF